MAPPWLAVLGLTAGQRAALGIDSVLGEHTRGAPSTSHTALISIHSFPKKAVHGTALPSPPNQALEILYPLATTKQLVFPGPSECPHLCLSPLSTQLPTASSILKRFYSAHEELPSPLSSSSNSGFLSPVYHSV